jgi:hypothetical protein
MEESVRESMNGRRSKDEIQSHIEATQEELKHTLAAIGESISPGEMIDTALYALRIGPGEFAANLGRSVRDNPVAIGLVGAGLAWLMLGTSTRESIRERAGETGHRLKERAGETGHRLKERAGETGHQLRSQADKLRGKVEGAAQEAGGEASGGAQKVADASREKAEQAKESARRGLSRARGLVSDQPLVVAAVGLFAGLTAAAMLPRSRTEERLLGERAEHMAETAEDAARGVAEGVREGFEAHADTSGDSGGDEPTISDPSTGERR